MALTEKLRVSAGAFNVFNTCPDKSTVPNTISGLIYGSNSPLGAYGGYHYATARLAAVTARATFQRCNVFYPTPIYRLKRRSLKVFDPSWDRIFI